MRYEVTNSNRDSTTCETKRDLGRRSFSGLTEASLGAPIFDQEWCRLQDAADHLQKPQKTVPQTTPSKVDWTACLYLQGPTFNINSSEGAVFKTVTTFPRRYRQRPPEGPSNLRGAFAPPGFLGIVFAARLPTFTWPVENSESTCPCPKIEPH